MHEFLGSADKELKTYDGGNGTLMVLFSRQIIVSFDFAGQGDSPGRNEKILKTFDSSLNITYY